MRERERERERATDRQIDRQTGRERERERERQTDRQTETHKQRGGWGSSKISKEQTPVQPTSHASWTTRQAKGGNQSAGSPANHITNHRPAAKGDYPVPA